MGTVMTATEGRGTHLKPETSVVDSVQGEGFIFINIKQLPSDSDVFYSHCPCYASTLTPKLFGAK